MEEGEASDAGSSLLSSSDLQEERSLLPGVSNEAKDPACSQCDDGGTVLSCDGLCLRSFHLGLDGDLKFCEESCNPLQLPSDLAKALNQSTKLHFVCPSCHSSVHTCRKCNVIGDSDPYKPFSADTVARCVEVDCGFFYHPRCIGKTSDDLGTKYFVCPYHVCAEKKRGTCHYTVDSGEPLIQCRRCPTSYHLACVPKQIMRTKDKSHGKRIWLGQGKDGEGCFIGDPVDRSLLYCMDHKIPKAKENPPLETELFDQRLLDCWRRHCINQYTDLRSSKEWLKHHPRVKAICRFPEDLN